MTKFQSTNKLIKLKHKKKLTHLQVITNYLELGLTQAQVTAMTGIKIYTPLINAEV
jgi:hypothetical protein